MIFIRLSIILFVISSFAPLIGKEGPSSKKIKTLYTSLDPYSVVQHLAFYDLYSSTPEGQMALDRAIALLSQRQPKSQELSETLHLPESAIDAIISLVNPVSAKTLTSLNEAEIELIEKFGISLKNRKLKGSQARSQEEVLALDPSEVDLARGMLLSQFGNNEEAWKQIRTFEAVLDLMALQVRARLGQKFTPERAIKELNCYVFEEMEFRFPPHSCYAKDIDLYSFLPSVIESRRGVCLGVSILYLCLGQRLGIPLEIITPPGHIYVRYNDGTKIINIETTARGIHLDSEEYLAINTRALQKRNIKETIGFSHFNKASGHLGKGDFQSALTCYETSSLYLPDDRYLKELSAYCHLIVGQNDKGFSLLKQANVKDPYLVSIDPLAEDLLMGNADPEDISPIFTSVDETRESLVKKYEAMKNIVEKNPYFRMGWFYLGTALLQLHRNKDALEALEKYHALDPSNPTIEYYLTILNGERWNFHKSWEHLRNAEAIVQGQNHSPRVLKELRLQLSLHNPEYKNRR